MEGNSILHSKFSQSTFSGYGVKFHPIKPKDLLNLRRWRNSERVSAQMKDSTYIKAENQRAWFENSLNRDNFAHWIVSHKGVKTGYVSIRAEKGTLTSKTYLSGGYYVGDSSVVNGLLGYAMVLMYHDIIFNFMQAPFLKDFVLKTNSTARRLNKQFGYIEEPQDELYMTITLKPEDYEKNKQKFVRYFKNTECKLLEENDG